MADLQVLEEEVKIIKPKRIMLILDMDEVARFRDFLDSRIRHTDYQLMWNIKQMVQDILEDGNE